MRSSIVSPLAPVALLMLPLLQSCAPDCTYEEGYAAACGNGERAAETFQIERARECRGPAGFGCPDTYAGKCPRSGSEYNQVYFECFGARTIEIYEEHASEDCPYRDRVVEIFSSDSGGPYRPCE